MNILTNKIQTALLNYYIFENGCELACTEVYTTHSFIGDIVAIQKNNVIEVEIKISLGDFKNELKKSVETFNNEKKCIELINKHEIMKTYVHVSPNKYYVCVPKYLLNQAIEFVIKLNPKYGVLCFDEDSKKIVKSISVKRKAQVLHKENNIEKYKKRMINRLGNDITNKYKLLYWDKKIEGCFDEKEYEEYKIEKETFEEKEGFYNIPQIDIIVEKEYPSDYKGEISLNDNIPWKSINKENE